MKLIMILVVLFSHSAFGDTVQTDHENKVGYRYFVSSEAPKALALGDTGEVTFRIQGALDTLVVSFSVEGLSAEMLDSTNDELRFQVFGTVNGRAYLNLFLEDEKGVAGVYAVGIDIGQVASVARTHSSPGEVQIRRLAADEDVSQPARHDVD